MFSLERFISEHVTLRPGSLFQPDMEANAPLLRKEIEGRKVLVIGGAGSIGSAFIKELCLFRPATLVVVDINENGLVELTRELRSSAVIPVPGDYRSYTLNFADPILKRIFRMEKGFDVVANFSAHKHVRSEKDRFSVQALIENNDIKAAGLMELLCEYPPKHFFCVSTDKAAGPVNIMGASKRLMEDMIMSYSDRFPVTTARFANVAFSNGSLPRSFMDRLELRQPLVAPKDVLRYFVSPRESGQICLLACILGKSGEIFFPKLEVSQMKSFSEIADAFLRARGYEPLPFHSDADARAYAASMPENTKLWPVVYTSSDTSGEKAAEEFFVPGESLDMDRFGSLGVVSGSPRLPKEKVQECFAALGGLFAKEDFSKEDIVKLLEKYIPSFHHMETGKNLDQKM